jgi:multidrug efflux pump
MNITDIFIRRPVLAIVVNLVIVIAGIQALGISTVVSGLQSIGLFKSVDTSKLPAGLNVRQYPRSENASVTVTTVYVGADANLVRGFITQPLERAIAAADGIEYLQSQSGQNVSTITARLKLNYDAT